MKKKGVSMVHNSRIFVSVASYRDSQVEKTIQSLYQNADHPDLIDVGVLAQVHLEEDGDCYLHSPEQYPNVLQEVIDYRESKGACWARSRILTTMRADQPFILQIDSHTRFSKQWDTRLKQMWYGLNDSKGVLTHYPMSFDSEKEELYEQHHTQFKVVNFLDSKIPSVDSLVRGFQDVSAIPLKTFFIAGGFLFGPRAMVEEVPYDPYIYFNGEEITYAVRLWTHGYNLYLPAEGFVWHDYHDGGHRKRHWSDLPEEFARLHNLSIQRILHLLRVEPVREYEALKDLSLYDLGFERSLTAYEHYSGIQFHAQKFSEKAAVGEVDESPLQVIE